MKERVLILGGGIIGLSCAYEAARGGGREVTIIEKGGFGGQATGAAAGMLAPFSENADQPDAFFHLCAGSLLRYPDWTAAIEEASGMKAGLKRTGSVGVAYHEADLLPLRSRLDWQRAAGSGAELLSAAELARMEPLLARGAAGGIYTPSEAHVEAPRLAAALAEACRLAGIRMIGGAGSLRELALRTSGSGERSVALSTDYSGEHEADRLLICTGAWSGEFEVMFGLPESIHPIRGQICAFDVPDGAVRHMVFSSQAYWVGKSGNALVCGASEDVAGFDASVTEKGIGRLERWSSRIFPFLEGARPKLRWAGLRPATRDGRPMIGALSDHPQVIVAAGHYRNGILLAPATAAAVGELLDGTKPEWIASFSPERFAAAARGGAEAGRNLPMREEFLC